MDRTPPPCKHVVVFEGEVKFAFAKIIETNSAERTIWKPLKNEHLFGKKVVTDLCALGALGTPSGSNSFQ